METSLSLLQVLEDEEEAALEKEDQEREQEVSYQIKIPLICSTQFENWSVARMRRQKNKNVRWLKNFKK